MGEQKQRPEITAAVIVLVFMLVGYIVYTLLVSPSSIFQITNVSNISFVSNVSQISKIYSLLGNTANFSETTTLGSFSLFGILSNTSLGCKNISLSTSILGSNEFTVPINSSAYPYYLKITPLALSGTPKLSIYYNNVNIGQYYLKVGEPIIQKVEATVPGNIAFQLNLNGFALSQSAKMNICLYSEKFNRTLFQKSISLEIIPKMGEFYVSFTPIGNGTLYIAINKQLIFNNTFVSNKQYNVSLPVDLQLNLLSNVQSDINIEFYSNGNVMVSNANFVYALPSENNTISNTYNISYSPNGYQMDIQIIKEYRPGNITIIFPNGNLVIPSNKISTETIVTIPSSYLGIAYNGYVSGYYKIISNGLYLIGQIGII